MTIRRGLIFSLGFHFLLLAVLALLPQQHPSETVAIELITPPPSQKARQVIRRHAIPEDLQSESSKDPWRFLSERNQQVREQMRALQSGLTKNRSQTNREKTVKTPKQLGHLLPSPIHIPTPQEFAAEQEKGISTFGNDLPTEIKIGSMTALNTERYLYYSYFARAEELLRHEWEPKILQIIQHPPPQITTSVHRTFTTELEVWFYPDGRYHSAHIMKPSGVVELDRAASESFRLVKMIPNPPREKVEKDGLVRFKWGMSVEYDPKVLVRQ
jgi:hypothetical protein